MLGRQEPHQTPKATVRLVTNALGEKLSGHDRFAREALAVRSTPLRSPVVFALLAIAAAALATAFTAPQASAATGDLTQKAPSAGCIANTGSPGGCTDAEALGGAFSVTVSPDGNYAYVVASNDNAVSIFDRNASTGALSWKGCVKDALESDLGLCNSGYPLPNPRSMAISPDGKWAYVVSALSESPPWRNVAIFNRDPTTGLLIPTGFVPTGVAATGAGSITLSPDGENVYIASSYFEISAGEERSVSEAVSEFKRDAVSGELGSLNCISERGLNGICEDGVALEGATSVAVSPDGKHVYVASRISNAIAYFSRDTSTGELTAAGVASPAALSGPRSVTVSPDGKNLYAAADTGDAVVVFDRNAVSGALTQKALPAGCISQTGAGSCTDGEGLNGPNSVTVSPDGESVYVGSLVSDAVALFERDTATGALAQKPGKAGCISSNGALAAVCETGIGLNGIRSLIVSPDGKSLYTAATVDGTVAIFDRETPTAPDTTIDSGPTGTITTDEATFTFSGTPAGDTAKIQCQIDGQPFEDCTSPKTFTGLSDGSHTATFRAEDAAGNQDPTPATATFTVDTIVYKAKIGKVKVKGPGKAKKGKKATYKVKVSNSGNAPATGVKLQVKGKGVKAKKSVGKISAGKAKTVKLKLKLKKPGKVKLTFKVTSENAGGKSVKKTVKVKK
jgi:DNA-binding beta-propeller fold protein YncE